MQHEKYLLVQFSTSKWSARKFDARATQEVADNHHATTDIGRFNKLLLNKSDINPVNAAFAAARVVHDKLTLPWDNEGDRLLPAAKLFAYREAMRPMLEEIDQRVAHLISRYSDLIEERRNQMNGLFEPADYPSVKEISQKFGHRIEIKPLPPSSALRFGDDAKVEQELREQYDAMVKDRVGDAQKEVWERLMEPLRRLVGVLTRDGRVYESTQKAILDIAKLVPEYNISGDPKLDAAAAEIFGLISKVSIDQLRDDELVREAVAEDAGELIKRMDDRFAGAF